MKRSIFLSVFFALFVIAAAAQNVQPISKDSIIFEKVVHDYGTIQQGSDGGCEFIFTNKGTKPLVLTDVRASCGCTAPTWPREPILPGQNGTIKVGYNTQILGNFSKVISVSSNAANGVVILTVKGSVVQKQ